MCASYRPKFGQGRKGGLTVTEFQSLYGGDPFYSWFGLDNPLMYAAHKAAGGITSVYRQIGIAGERLFRAVLMDELGLDEDEATWSYTVQVAGGRTRKLSLDGRIPLDSVQHGPARARVADWMARAAADLGVQQTVAASLQGPVFEVRQGYKSKDSKRQNADIANQLGEPGKLVRAGLIEPTWDGDRLNDFWSSGLYLTAKAFDLITGCAFEAAALA